MGAWGAGPFENDDALELLEELDDDPLGTLEATLTSVAEAPSDDVDASDAARAVAAAALVAGLCGAQLRRIHPDAAGWVAENTGTLVPPPSLVDVALAALEAVRSGGELWEVWDEKDAVEEFEATVVDLEDALSS